jgi:hypothetical protein
MASVAALVDLPFFDIVSTNGPPDKALRAMRGSELPSPDRTCRKNYMHYVEPSMYLMLISIHMECYMGYSDTNKKNKLQNLSVNRETNLLSLINSSLAHVLL